MARDHAQAPGQGQGGSADRQDRSTDASRLTDWQRIEAEKPQRDAARKAWDATHNPSPEFENAIRPLADDYGRDRPHNRDLTDEQRTKLEETFGRPIDELLALRDKDPRADHNRDEQGRILDHDGNPRTEKTTEQILREAERQAKLYGPASEAPDVQAPSDQSVETDTSASTDNDAAGEAATTPTDASHAAEHDREVGLPDDLDQLLGRITIDLHDGKLTPDEAANQLEAFRDRISPATPEPSTETIRTEQAEDGPLYFQRGAPETTEDTPGERTANEESDKVSRRRRNVDELARGSEVIPDLQGMVDDAQAATHRLPPGAHGETTTRQPDVPAVYNRTPDALDPSNLLAAGMAATVAIVVFGQRLGEKIHARNTE